MQMANLLLLLSHADTAVKATLCEEDTLKTLFRAIEYCPHHLQHTALKAIKQLTSDPSMLEALQVGPWPPLLTPPWASFGVFYPPPPSNTPEAFPFPPKDRSPAI